MTLRNEWEKIIQEKDNIYIFGAGDVARRIFCLLCEYDKQSAVKGFIVSKIDGNPQKIADIDVTTVDDLKDKDANIFVTVSKVYHPEVYDSLKSLGFMNIQEIHKFYMLELSSDRNDNIFVESDLIDYKIADQLSEKELLLRNLILELFRKNKQTFGDTIFYQSYERLGIKGLRPTSKRIEKYGVMDDINVTSKILDIGCNFGFFDLTLADRVKSIVGIEYNEKLVEIAQTVASNLNISNVVFECSDYNDWQSKCVEKYDVIFSFAVHVWLNVSPEVYAKQLYNMLNYGGMLFFESQDISHDIMFDKFCNEFVNHGLSIVRDSMIKDDGKIERKYVVFRKEI